MIKKKTEEGKARRIGLELEFAGIEIPEVAEIIKEIFGGEISEIHRYEYKIVDTELGDFRVELDARILRKMANKNLFKRWGIEINKQAMDGSIGDILDRIAKTVIPLEIVMPPIPVNQLDELEKLRIELQKNRAVGTTESWIHAFGLHMNIEVPTLECRTVTDYFKAFLILYPWLLEILEIDLSRRLSPFIDPFPTDFVNRVLSTDYGSDSVKFTGDYLQFNPTRNRPLDLMPILSIWEPGKVNKVLKGEKNKPRPAFHYRLPNSRINDENWSFREEWKYWCEVEKLSGKKEMLRKLSRLYVTRYNSKVVSFKKEWTQTVTILLDLDHYE